MSQFSLEFALGKRGVPLHDLAQVLGSVSCDEFDQACLGFLLVQIPTLQGKTPPQQRLTHDWGDSGADGTLLVTPSHVWKLKEDQRQARQAIVHILSADEESPLTLGRAEGCDVVLGESTVSTRHAEIRVREDYEVVWQLSDLDSRNGTFVDGVKLSSGETVRLEDGQNLWFSSYKALFLSAEEFHSMVTAQHEPK